MSKIIKIWTEGQGAGSGSGLRGSVFIFIETESGNIYCKQGEQIAQLREKKFTFLFNKFELEKTLK